MSQKKRFYKFREIFPWFVAGLAVLSSHLTADYIWDWTNKTESETFSLLKIIYVIVFIGSAYLTYWLKNNFFKIHVLHKPPEKRKHLVLFLSNLQKNLAESNGIPDWIKLSNDINKDIRALEEHKENSPPLRWSWEMPLRGIRHHLNPMKLETVTMVCSNESILQVQWFLNICRQYDQLRNVTFYVFAKKDDRPEIICTSPATTINLTQGFDFENFEELSDAMRNLLKVFKEKNYDEKEIMVDFTGGQKVTSIVAISMTVNRKINAQYVQTNKWWNVLSYSVRHFPSAGESET